MPLKQTLVLGVLMGTATFNANAASLSPYSVNGVNLVYSGDHNISWTQDANLFKTMYDADNTLISQITNITPSYNDPLLGLQTIDDNPQSGFDDFDTTTGRMSWWGGIAFFNYLNNIAYGGSNQWRLPSFSEFNSLFYNELGGTFMNSIPDTVDFINEQAFSYWEFAPEANIAPFFNARIGSGGQGFRSSLAYAWAVSPGQVNVSVSEPGVMWLLLTGLLGLLGLKRRGQSG